MTINSSGNGDDPDQDGAPGSLPFEGDDDVGDEATRILPLREAGAAPPIGTVIGSVGGTAQTSDDEGKTVMLPAGGGAKESSHESNFDPAVGWLVILDGPGRGQHCSIFYGQNSVGRGEDQRIRLNFGDARITRDTHAFLVYDDLGRKFYLRDNGKSNLIRLNKAPVIAPVELKDRDIIQIGETEMLFVQLCGPEFDWLSGDDGPATGADV